MIRAARPLSILQSFCASSKPDSTALVREFAHLRVERVAELGDPAQVISKFADQNSVDLIMMPT
ncbi:MAG: hypothetical protein DMG59_09030, partial [Acidobacteria bacterium]